MCSSYVAMESVKFLTRDSTRPEISQAIEFLNEYVFSCYVYTENSFCFIPSRVARLITRMPFFNPTVFRLALCDLKQILFFSQFCRLQKDSFVIL